MCKPPSFRKNFLKAGSTDYHSNGDIMMGEGRALCGITRGELPTVSGKNCTVWVAMKMIIPVSSDLTS